MPQSITQNIFNDLNKLMPEYNTPEKRMKREIAIEAEHERQDRLWKYLIENNCNTDDLIEAHRKLNKGVTALF